MIPKILTVCFSASEAVQVAGFAQHLGLPFDTLCFCDCAELDLGAEKVFSASLEKLPPADSLASAIARIAAPYSHIAGVSTMRSKDVLARVTGILDCAMLTDVISAESPAIFKRPILAGSVITTVELLAPQVVITFRPAGFAKGERLGSSEKENLVVDCTSMAKQVGESIRGGTRPDLSQAKVIVSGGRPMRDAATFEKVIGGLADRLGGAVGATRAAVDMGLAPNELQVGQTGKIVAPDLYIAAGISGSTQHMAGIKDSKIIVAINKDPDAPIFETADYGLVADLYDAIPAFQRALDES